ncbi:MAG: YaiO family outer membrane beta-barrel protein [Pricia sp.]|nr:YaiO family outer membrane beta-barrel protein [Pricia sp.]
MGLKQFYGILFFGLYGFWGFSQDMAYNNPNESSLASALHLAYEGDADSANKILIKILSGDPKNQEARSLLASTYSWNGQYDKARHEFNKITSNKRHDRKVWISSIKNELYANNNATALGLSNKALTYLKRDEEVERLREIAVERTKSEAYPESGWFNQENAIDAHKTSENSLKSEATASETEDNSQNTKKVVSIKPKTPLDKEVMKNKVGIRNSFTIFDQRYDPMIYSNISFKHQTKLGSIIPRLNYSNRLGQHGLQYDMSLYPKLAKRMYAYLNYGYSNATIYPKHKFAGDVYVNLPAAIELSAGGRYIKFESRNVSVITNSLGHYRGNYYFSLRSYVTPRSNNLTRVSGNLLVRKYLKDAENYIGCTFGMGYSPELRQLTSGDELLAETMLYIESQRLGIEYQFTGKNAPNIYKTNVGVRRQELVYDSGNFFWSVSAGLTYQVKF